jgi:hypothetical protein
MFIINKCLKQRVKCCHYHGVVEEGGGSIFDEKNTLESTGIHFYAKVPKTV